ncbi:hypothetical protein CUMW_238160 [Citrus unshiu]|uniref:Uncharacterized protein n=1 Tax=Citrus unshiu TaxID=55188 RepID=A0A2H5QK97_CITUN|nr:hypothetical protein CUMW_238160 [Citrus unshiu]
MYRHDIIAQICYARRLAEKLYHVARMIDLPGGHLVSHERTEEFFVRGFGERDVIRKNNFGTKNLCFRPTREAMSLSIIPLWSLHVSI